MNLKKATEVTLLTLLYIFMASKSIAEIKPEYFFKMIENNDVDGVTLAILDGFEINKLYNGRTPLCVAIRYSKPQIVKILLKSSASTELKDSSDFTPLMSAILWADVYHFPNKSDQDKMNSIEVFDILLAHSINISYNGTYGEKSKITPLGLAASLYNDALSIELVKKLLKAGADVNPNRTPENLSPLYWALTAIFTKCEKNGNKNNHSKLIQILLDAGADPNATCDGHTPLLIAAAYDYDLTKILLCAGADKRVKSKEGLTPFDMAMNSQNFETMKLLLTY